MWGGVILLMGIALTAKLEKKLFKEEDTEKENVENNEDVENDVITS